MSSEPDRPAASAAKSPIFVFDSPRTCSHLLRKLFLYHPDLGHILEPFLVASVFGYEGVTDSLTSTEAARTMIQQARDAVPELRQCTYAQANQAFAQKIETFKQEGKTPWTKDHAIYSVRPEIILSTLRSNLSMEEILENYINPTLIDDDTLFALEPVFLIRHPVQVIRSYWKVNLESIGSDAQDEQFAWMTSVRWVRILFEFFRKRNGKVPLLVDAEDVVHRTAELTEQLCLRLGLDREGVKFDWEPEAHPGMAGDFFKARIRASTGVERDADVEAKTRLDLDVAFAEWKEKYGESTAKALRQRVETELPDYEYLHQFKLLA